MPRKFKNPPINELVIGTYFNPPLFGLHAEHIGLFWSKIREEFPHISQQAPIGTIIEAPGDVFPLPRFWVTSEDDATLLQIQKNAFLLNWRKRDADYPHYDILKSKFDKYYMYFKDFLNSESVATNIGIEVCELAYINLITENDYWKGVGDIAKIFPSHQFIDIGCDGTSPIDVACTTVFQVEENLILKIVIQNVHPLEHPEVSHLRFEIRATGKFGNASKSDADEWFNRAHGAIGRCFKGVTDSYIQNSYWQPMEKD